MEKLRISENGRYFIKENGRPLIWLADTAWTVPSRHQAEGLANGLTGHKLRYDSDHEEWKKLLITYHACHETETGLCSTFSYWTEEDVLDRHEQAAEIKKVFEW